MQAAPAQAQPHVQQAAAQQGAVQQQSQQQSTTHMPPALSPFSCDYCQQRLMLYPPQRMPVILWPCACTFCRACAERMRVRAAHTCSDASCAASLFTEALQHACVMCCVQSHGCCDAWGVGAVFAAHAVVRLLRHSCLSPKRLLITIEGVWRWMCMQACAACGEPVQGCAINKALGRALEASGGCG